ncbi:hypothetical protein GHT06_013321 [Daphnia sinensis]|uniref:Protein big brother n=1 Tax=Daphnia sinensis TaxID=1820382 RepID=A0AAD5KXC5_9CRUS|nr:hypothetical protein GHT06_013321 [Daphnia sinensis]
MYKGMNQTAAQHLLSSMLPYDSMGGMGLYEQTKPSLMYRVPRVIPDQKGRFESDELFRRLSRESEVRYVGFRDRPMEERQMRFAAGCREGHAEIAIVATGTNFQLVFGPGTWGFSSDANRDCDFDKEPGKVHIKSRFILNGVCAKWRGWIDLDRLDGVGCVEFDEEAARIEDVYRREQVERFNQRLREFEEDQRAYRNHHVAAAVERQSQSEHNADLVDARKKMDLSAGHAPH